MFCVTCARPFCKECADVTHGNFLVHTFTIWNGEMFQESACADPPVINCCQNARKQLVNNPTAEVYDCFGRRIPVSVHLCSQCTITGAMLSTGYFPATKISCFTFVDKRLLDMLDCLTSDGKMSLLRAVRSILTSGNIPAASQCTWVQLYDSLRRNGVLQRYRQLIRQVIPWPTECLFCPNGNTPGSTPSTTCVSADACFGLRHRRRAGEQLHPLPTDGRLPAPFVHVPIESTEAADAVDDASCPNWRAGAINRKIASRALDVNAFFMLSCRHSIIVACADIRSPGERLIYAESCLRYFIEKAGVNGIVIFIYDVACKMIRRLQRIAMEYPFVSIIPAVNVFHAFAHKTSCRLKNSVRFVEGCGLTDGEHNERLNSAFRPYGPHLKEMRIDRRTYTLAHYVWRSNVNHLLQSASWLKDRLRLLDKHSASLKDILHQLLPEGRDPHLVLQQGQLHLQEYLAQQEALPLTPLERLRCGAVELRRLYSKIRQCSSQKDARVYTSELSVVEGEMAAVWSKDLPEFSRRPLVTYKNPMAEVYDDVYVDEPAVQFHRRAIEASALLARVSEECNLIREEASRLQLRLSQAIALLHGRPGLFSKCRCALEVVRSQCLQLSPQIHSYSVLSDANKSSSHSQASDDSSEYASSDSSARGDAAYLSD